MTTSIRIGDWTKDQLQEIRDAEDHSSHDSVIKSLLKERETAEVARLLSADDAVQDETWTPPQNKQYDALTVMEEAGPLDNGQGSLWCPGCGDEVLYLHMADLRAITNVHVDCPACDVELSADSLVYLAEEEWLDTHPTVDERQPELKAAVLDYWERSLDAADLYEFDDYQTIGSMLAGSYARTAAAFAWEWRPREVPVQSLSKWHTQSPIPEVYRNAREETFLVFTDWHEYDGSGWSDTEIVQWSTEGDVEAAERVRLPGTELEELIENWELFRTFPGPDAELPSQLTKYDME